MTRETLAVASPDGAQAELIVHAADAPVLLYWLPAMGVTGRNYDRFASELAALGIGVAAHEWRGAGSSDRRAARASDWGYRELLDDVAAGMATLRARHPQARVYVGGHSLGAQLAALALARDPRLAGLVIVASGIPYWRSFPWWQQPILLCVFAWFRLLSALYGYFPGRRTGFAGNEAKTVIRDWSRSGLHGRYRDAWPEGDVDRDLAALKHPLLAFHLRDDRYAPSSSFAALLARMPNTQLRRVDLTPADFDDRLATHFSWMKDPRPVARSIVEWFGREA